MTEEQARSSPSNRKKISNTPTKSPKNRTSGKKKTKGTNAAPSPSPTNRRNETKPKASPERISSSSKLLSKNGSVKKKKKKKTGTGTGTGGSTKSGKGKKRGAIPKFEDPETLDDKDKDDGDEVGDGVGDAPDIPKLNLPKNLNNQKKREEKPPSMERLMSGLDIEEPVGSARKVHERDPWGSNASIDPTGIMLESTDDIRDLSSSRRFSSRRTDSNQSGTGTSMSRAVSDMLLASDESHRRSSSSGGTTGLSSSKEAGSSRRRTWSSNWLENFEGGKLRHSTIPLKQQSHDYKTKLETGVVRFNEKPKEGIQYLVEEGLVEDNPVSVAQFLLHTEGLSKTKIGIYLGEGNPFCINVMHAYVDELSFKGMDFDSALRHFLSGFRLAGEAQKIDRMMEKFSNRYCIDNPTVFQHPDAAYLLAFGLIMLNTDAHSKRVKNKMTKKQFLRNCQELLEQGMSKEYLINAYDNIVNNEIKVELDYLEQLYARIQASEISGVQYGAERRAMLRGIGGTKSELLETKSEYPVDVSVTDSSGTGCASPTRQLVADESGVAGGDVPAIASVSDMSLAQLHKLSGGNVFMKHGRRGKPHDRKVWLSDNKAEIWWQDPEQSKPAKFLKCEDITDIYVGRDTSAVFRRSEIPAIKDALCFSIVTPSRTLDLEAHDQREVRLWVNFLTQVVEDNMIRDEVRQREKMKQVKEREVIESLDEWKHFMVDNWQFYSGESNGKNASTFHRIWMKGIPPAIRCEIWPKAIGNELRISNELTDAFLRQARLHWETYQTEPDKAFLGHHSSVEQMLVDMPNTFPELKFFHVEGPMLHKDTLRELLLTYMFYRPDIGYMSGMSHIAAMILLYTRFENAFSAFSNLLHSHYFLCFLRMDMDQVRWRLDYFESLVQSQMPSLHQHFKHLHITWDSFFIDWCTTLFSKFLPLDTVARVWDIYLLEGESYVYRVSLAILRLFEHRLLRCCYTDCLLLLTTMVQEINETKFWELVEAVNVEEPRFHSLLESNTKHLSGIRSSGPSMRRLNKAV